MSEIISGDEVPASVVNAAELVSRYFSECNVADWRLAGCASIDSLSASQARRAEVEKNFLKTTFSIRAVAEETVGCGVDLLQGQVQADEPGPEDDEELHKRPAPHLRTRGAQFRRRHRLQGQYLLYGGRIDAGKGCEELFEYFTSYKEQGGGVQGMAAD